MAIETDTQLRGIRKRWRLVEPVEVDRLARALRVDPLVAQLLASRGVDDADAARVFLDPKLTHLHDPAKLAGCARAAERLVEAVRGGEPIAIYGDYDVDGVTATAILFHIIRAADPNADVRRYVPHRIDEGYGLNPDAVAQLADEGARVIISVDCGITAVGPAAIAKEHGVDLIITDHHEPNADGSMPDAYATVHPALDCEATGEPYPWRDLCGAGVAYKIAWQFARTWCGSDRVTEKFRDTLIDLLSLAALGTVADVVPLVDENRAITIFGLRRIKQTPLVGLNALIDASRLRDEKIDSYHVGFVLGPRLNACGRMGHAKEAVDLLTDAPPPEAEAIAETLTGINDERRATERKIFEQAVALVDSNGYDSDECRAIVLGDDDWHPGVVGIVCSRLVEKFGRPTVLVNTSGDQAGGSARSIDGFSIVDAFTACAEHLDRYGGHAMAAGLKLPTKNLDAFRDAMIAYAAQLLEPEDLVPLLNIDAEVGLDAITVGVGEQLERLAPFGRSNPAPVVLIRNANLKQAATTMGKEARHLCMNIEQDGRWLRCIAWNMGELAAKLPAGTRIDLAGQLKLNRYRGRVSVEMVIDDLRIVE